MNQRSKQTPIRASIAITGLLCLGATVPGITKAATYTTFDPKGSYMTYAFSISDLGSITGSYLDKRDVFHGYLRKTDGTITTFYITRLNDTYAFSINATGAIVGGYGTNKTAERSFVRSADGTI